MSVYPEEDKEQIPWDFIRIVSCKPEQLLFIAFPLAVLYKVFHFSASGKESAFEE